MYVQSMYMKCITNLILDLAQQKSDSLVAKPRCWADVFFLHSSIINLQGPIVRKVK
jgi:hypothetical protein